MLNFKDDFKEFEEEIIVIETTEGHYDTDQGNKWVEGTKTEVEVNAIVTQLTTRDMDSNIKYDEGGHYTLSDIKIYIFTSLKIGSTVEWKGREYTISNEIDKSNHSEYLRIYLAKKGVKDEV